MSDDFETFMGRSWKKIYRCLRAAKIFCLVRKSAFWTFLGQATALSRKVTESSLCYPSVKHVASCYLGGLWNHRHTSDWEAKCSVLWLCTFLACIWARAPLFPLSVWAETALCPNSGCLCLGCHGGITWVDASQGKWFPGGWADRVFVSCWEEQTGLRGGGWNESLVIYLRPGSSDFGKCSGSELLFSYTNFMPGPHPHGGGSGLL